MLQTARPIVTTEQVSKSNDSSLHMKEGERYGVHLRSTIEMHSKPRQASDRDRDKQAKAPVEGDNGSIEKTAAKRERNRLRLQSVGPGRVETLRK